jgi:hypothetical protein
MEEMRQLIGKRQTDLEGSSSRFRHRSVFETPLRESSPSLENISTPKVDETILTEADQDLVKALGYQTTLQDHLKQVQADLREVTQTLAFIMQFSYQVS